MLPSLVDALESRDDDDRARRRGRARMRSSSISRMRALVYALSVRMRTCAAGVALRLEPDLAQRDREQADRHLLAGRGDHVELARIGIRRDSSFASAEQPVGLAATSPTRRRPAGGLRGGSARRARATLRMRSVRADRRAAVLLDDQRHGSRGPSQTRVAERDAPIRARNASVAFVPPKPNEFDSAARIFIVARDVRHEVEIALRIAVDEIRRGRRDLVAQRERREHRLDAAGGAEQVSGHRFGRATRRASCACSPNARLTAMHSATSPSGVDVPCALM